MSVYLVTAEPKGEAVMLIQAYESFEDAMCTAQQAARLFRNIVISRYDGNERVERRTLEELNERQS